MTICTLLLPILTALLGPPAPTLTYPTIMPAVVADERNPSNDALVFTTPIGHYQGVRP
jgi:hypothetical protein